MEASRCCPGDRRCLRRGSPAPCGTCEIQRSKDPKQTNERTNERTNKQTRMTGLVRQTNITKQRRLLPARASMRCGNRECAATSGCAPSRPKAAKVPVKFRFQLRCSFQLVQCPARTHAETDSRVHARAHRVQVQLSDRDAHAPRAEIACSGHMPCHRVCRVPQVTLQGVPRVVRVRWAKAKPNLSD